MIDMKKYVRKKESTETHPSFGKITRQRATAVAEYPPSTLCAANFFKIALPVKRPIRKQRKPNEARLDDALLLKPSAPFGCVSIQPLKKPVFETPGACHHAGTGGTCDGI